MKRSLFATGLFVVLGTANACAQTNAATSSANLSAMLAFDAEYIPVLSLTSQAQTNIAVGTKAKASALALAGLWAEFHPRLKRAFPSDPKWGEDLAQVSIQIQAGREQAEKGDFGAAHESLEAVRILLMVGRKRNGMEYFLDRLTAYHEPMEAIVLAAKDKKASEFGTMQRSKLELDLARALELWGGIEAHMTDVRDYPMSQRQKALVVEGITSERAALARLSKALSSGTLEELLRAAVAIKPEFAKLFIAFGRPSNSADGL